MAALDAATPRGRGVCRSGECPKSLFTPRRVRSGGWPCSAQSPHGPSRARERCGDAPVPIKRSGPILEAHVSQPKPLTSPLLFRAFLTLVVVTLLVQTAKFSGLVGTGPKVLVDFDAFHILGGTVWRGEVEQAYHFVTMVQAQRPLGGADGFLPWTYPPPFNLVAAALALLPLGAAYFAFGRDARRLSS